MAATSLILSTLHLDGFLPYKDCQEQQTRFTVAWRRGCLAFISVTESWVLVKADAILNGNTRSTVFCKHLTNGFANFVVCSSARFNLFADEGPCYVHC